jgi:hypothetical protein
MTQEKRPRRIIGEGDLVIHRLSAISSRKQAPLA